MKYKSVKINEYMYYSNRILGYYELDPLVGYYEFDPFHCISVTGMSWDAILKINSVELE